MGRDELGRNEGMVFIFPNEALTGLDEGFKLPLDILFFDKHLTLISVFEGQNPTALTAFHRSFLRNMS